jgi:methyl-accepting chemotaxis protein
MVQRKKATTIRSKLTRQMLVVGIVPLVVLGGVAYFTMSSAVNVFGRGLETSAQAMESGVVGATLTKAAEDVTARIDSYVEERVKDVVIWASDPLVIEAAVRANALARARGWPGYPEITQDQKIIDRIEEEMKASRTLNPVPATTQYLKDQLALSKVFKEVFFTDKGGYNAAISNMTSDFVQSDEEWWVNAWTKGIDIGGTSQNPLTMKKSAATGARVTYDESAGVWAIAISVRIDHPRTKEPLGVMKAVLDISAVQAIASRAALKIRGGDVKVLVAATGELIADTSVQHARKFIMSTEGNLLSRHFKPAEAIGQREGPRSGYLIGQSEFHGTAQAVDQVIGFAKSAAKGEFKDVPGFEGLGWAAVVGQEKQHAFAALDELTRVQRALVGQRRWLQALILGVVVLATLAILGLGAVLGRRIATPIQELSVAAKRVSDGDLGVQVRVRSEDEIGRLTQTFNDTVVRLRSQVQTEAERDEERRTRLELQRNITRFLDTVMEISQGDLTKRGEVTADVLGSVVDATNVMVEEIAAIVGSVRTAALQVAGSASDMIVAAGDMTNGAQAQTREAMSVTTAMEELTLSVRQVAASAEDSAQAAQQALKAAKKGDDAVRESLDGMQRIRREVQAISKRIKNLGDRSLEISAIVSTIEDIAGQTNLLALNATIEAAGAGEAGLRFAVVADEVRKLAERVARSTKDIAGLIKTVQAETQEAVLVAEHGTNEVESGYQLTVQAGASLKEIAAVAKRSAGLAQDISLATAQQARGTETVAAAVQSISSVAVETEHGVLRTRKTIDELVKVAEELTSTLARFKLAA